MDGWGVGRGRTWLLRGDVRLPVQTYGLCSAAQSPVEPAWVEAEAEKLIWYTKAEATRDNF